MSVSVRQDPQLMEVNPPLVQGGLDFHDVTDDISSITEAKVYETPMKYWITLSITGTVLALLGGHAGVAGGQRYRRVGATTVRSGGRGTSRTSCSGSVSVTRAR